MNKNKIFEIILSIIKPVLLAIIGGLIVVAFQKDKVNQGVTIQDYENQLKNIRQRQDSLVNVLPDINQSKKYLSDRYPERNESKPNR